MAEARPVVPPCGVWSAAPSELPKYRASVGSLLWSSFVTPGRCLSWTVRFLSASSDTAAGQGLMGTSTGVRLYDAVAEVGDARGGDGRVPACAGDAAAGDSGR